MVEQLWKKRREFYKLNATITSARSDDQVADHICRGLGFQPREMGRVERLLGLNVDEELPKIQHVRTILNAVSHGAFATDTDDKPRALLDVKEVTDLKRWLAKHMEEYAELSEGMDIGVILCLRDKDPKSLKALVFVEDTTPVVLPWLLQPGSCLVEKTFGTQVWRCDVSTLMGNMSKLLKWEQVGILST